MENDSNKKDVISEIDAILAEVRQQHSVTQENPQIEQPKPKKAEPQQNSSQQEEEEFVDINASTFAQSTQPAQASPQQPVADEKEQKKAEKLEKKAAQKAKKDAEKEKKAAEKSAKEAKTQKAEVSDNGISLEPENTSVETNSNTVDADAIIAQIPSLATEQPTQQPATNYYQPTQSQNPPKEKKKGKAKFIVLGTAGLIILLCGSFFASFALNPDSVPTAAPIPEVESASNESQTEFVFAKGVSINGIDIGGKNQKEAKALVKIKESDFKNEFSVNVNYGDNKKLTYTQDDFSYNYNTDEVFEQALQYSRDVSTALAEGTIDELVVPDTYNVTVNEEDGTIDFAVSAIISESSIEKVVNRSAGKIDKNAVEPHAEKYDPYATSFDKMFTWVEGENGTVIDKEDLLSQLNELFKNGATSGDVTVKTTTEKPKHTMDEVKNNVQLIGQFSTVSTNGYNANCNMATALNAVDGTIVDPGDIFSFNECTGDSNLTENGYLPASVIMNEEYVSGIGGGICQAATTIYNATLLAGMGIEERAYHFYTSIYVYGGLDATIDYPNLDLKMKNTTDYQIFLHTWMDGVTLHCEVYGWQSPEWDEIRTETACSWVGDESFGFEAQRVFYKDNKEVKREDMPDSVYSLKNGHYVVAGDPGDVSNKIKDPKKNLKIKS